MRSRITVNPKICHGKPVVRHTRVLVSNILADLAAGASHAEILAHYSNIAEADIRAALAFGSELARFESEPLEVPSR